MIKTEIVLIQVVGVVALAGLVLVSILVNQPIRFPLDDAYITIANAELLLLGGADSYGNAFATGATSPAHLLLLTLFGTLLSLPVANLMIAVLAAVIYALGLFRLMRTLGVPMPWSVLTCLTGLCYSSAWAQLLNGLETGIAMAALAWTVCLLQKPEEGGTRAPLAILLGFLPFIRPELALLTALIVASELWRWRQEPRALLLPLGWGIATILLVACLAWMATGTLVPPTAGAKEAFFAEAQAPLITKLTRALHVIWSSALWPILIGLVFLPRLRGGWAVVGLATGILLAAIITLPSALAHNHFRYLYVLMPMGLVGWATLVREDGEPSKFGKTAIILFAVLALVRFPFAGLQDYREGLSVTEDQERLVDWAKSNLPSDARILIHDAGYFGWQTEFTLVDVVGLKTPEAIALHRQYTLPSLGRDRGKVIDIIARQSEATHAIILNDPFWSTISANLREYSWKLEPLRRDTNIRYQVYRLTPPAHPVQSIQ